MVPSNYCYKGRLEDERGCSPISGSNSKRHGRHILWLFLSHWVLVPLWPHSEQLAPSHYALRKEDPLGDHVQYGVPAVLEYKVLELRRKSVLEASDPIFYQQPLLKPYVFFDVSHGREQRGGIEGGSLRNQVSPLQSSCMHRGSLTA